MLKKNDLVMLSHFRTNSRISLTKLSKITKIPVSTLFDKLKLFESKSLIRKNTVIIDFKKLGFEIKNVMLLSAKNKENLQKFLLRHPKVNNVFKINNGFDFIIEVVFKDLSELNDFFKQLDSFEIVDKKEFFILEDLKREEFLSADTKYPEIINF